MKKKIVLLIGGLLVLAVVLPVVLTMRLWTTREVVIHTSLFDVAPALTDLHNWKNWYPDPERDVFTVTAKNPAGIVVRDKKQRYQSLLATADTNRRYTLVRWAVSSTVAEWLGGRRPGGMMEQGLKTLKAYLEDPVNLYGFTIGIQPVTDTLILTKRAIVSRDKVKEKWAALEKELIAYLLVNRMLRVEVDIYNSTEPVSSDSLAAVVGIPVSSRRPEKEGMQFLKLPAQGRLLVGRYEGPDSVMPRLYLAMDKYVLDKELKKVAVPFEKRHVKFFGTEEPGRSVYELVYPIY
jgi:hypothetical protein